MSDLDLSLPEDILRHAAASPNPLVQRVASVLKQLTSLRCVLDSEVVARQIPVAVFKEMALQAKSAREINCLYWRDTAQTIHTYALSSTWRLVELIEQTVRLLRSNGVLGPAILGRSLVELTTSFMITCGSIRTAVTLSAEKWHRETVLGCEQLELLLNKAMYGSRLLPEDDPLRQTNILTLLQKLAKLDGFQEVMEHYERLCEVAHPNFLGHARFWADDPIPQKDGSLLRIGSQHVKNAAVNTIRADTLWSLAWAAENTRRGYEIVGDQVRRVFASFPEEHGSPEKN